MRSWLIAMAIACACACPGGAAEPTPFAGKPGPPAAVAARVAASVAIPLGAWSVLDPAAGEACWRIAGDTGTAELVVDLARVETGSTKVWMELPPAVGKEAWDRQGCDCIAFAARSVGGPVALDLYAIAGRRTAMDAGMHCPFLVDGEDWRQIVIPLAWLGVKRPATVHGIGFARSASTVEPGAAPSLHLRDLRLVRSVYAETDLLRQAPPISLLGSWRFAPEAGGADWARPDYDDSGWRTVKSGESLQDQGLQCPGWSWYRQAVVIPEHAARCAVSLDLPAFMFDDEVYVNGQKIGGTAGMYRFAEFDQRHYTIPPAVIHYGAANSLAIRLWGSDALRQGRSASGLVPGPCAVRIQPAALYARTAEDPTLVPIERFDISRAQQGLHFELVARLPEGVAIDPAAIVRCALVDAADQPVHDGPGRCDVDADGRSVLVTAVAEETARELYLRGRYAARFTAVASTGDVLLGIAFRVDRPCCVERDRRALPPLDGDVLQETPYGKLRLVDEIDAAEPIAATAHPYMQNRFATSKAGTPGGSVQVRVRDILGQPARVADGTGWFAYRIGRGELHEGGTYLLRIAYPEDVPRYAAVQIQTGRNQVGVGWRNGVGPGDPYDDYPLSGTWRWFDVIVVAGAGTAGHQGAYSAPGGPGFWVYFLNKVNPGKYFPMYAGGPAVGRIQLFAIDATENAPSIRRPEGLPARALLFDWEREPDQDVASVCRYARLMGYSGVAPTILKWGTSLWAPPLAGYEAAGTDLRGYTVARRSADPQSAPAEVTPGQPTVHESYLRQTAENHLSYIPRIEYGGSALLPEADWAVDPQGGFAKPNRFAQWSANLLDDATFADFKALLDHLIKPHADSSLAGILWRIRCERMQISYGTGDMLRFFQDTGREMPQATRRELASRAAFGDLADAYRAWWFGKRAEFHIRVRDLLRSYRPDLDLYYYNWDIDKWGLGIYDQTTAKYFADIAQAGEGNAMQVYKRNLATIAGYSGDDFVRMVRTGTINAYMSGRADQAMEMAPYRSIEGIHVFCPTNYVYSSDSPAYLDYFRTGSGVAVSNTISYDENGYKRLHPAFECNMVIGGGGSFSMANEVLAWFHADARVLTFTAYTFARGFADAHRRFAQAFLALPALPGTELASTDPGIRIRSYADGSYIGLANKTPNARTVTVKLPGHRDGAAVVTDLVSGAVVPSRVDGDGLTFDVQAGPMELDAYCIR